MSSDNYDVIINQSENAASEARSFRRSAEDIEKAETRNIEDAMQRAENAEDENDKTYWTERAQLLRDEMDKKMADLHDKARQKDAESKEYRNQAAGVAHDEDRQKKLTALDYALRALDNN